MTVLNKMAAKNNKNKENEIPIIQPITSAILMEGYLEQKMESQDDPVYLFKSNDLDEALERSSILDNTNEKPET